MEEQINQNRPNQDICIQHQQCLSGHPNHCEIRKQIYKCCKLGELMNFFLVRNSFKEMQVQQETAKNKRK
jgi:hypothetical protein